MTRDQVQPIISVRNPAMLLNPPNVCAENALPSPRQDKLLLLCLPDIATACQGIYSICISFRCSTEINAKQGYHQRSLAQSDR